MKPDHEHDEYAPWWLAPFVGIVVGAVLGLFIVGAFTDIERNKQWATIDCRIEALEQGIERECE